MMNPFTIMKILVQNRIFHVLTIATLLGHIYLNCIYTSTSPAVVQIAESEAVQTLKGSRQNLRSVEPGNFPELLASEAIILQNLSRHIDLFQTISEKNVVLKTLSSIVEAQLIRLQSVDQLDCTNRPTILCGHHVDGCGFGCQIGHRKTCLALSYATNLPLIHDEVTSWPYKKQWREAFQQLGSNCKPGPRTYYVRWREHGGPILIKGNSSTTVPFPFVNGLIVPKILGGIVSKIHLNPFQWWTGQFAKFTIRLTQTQRNLVKESKIKIGLTENQHPTFGFQVRRTDKSLEEANTWHPIADYFRMMYQFKDSVNLRHNSTIYIASEDHTVLPEAIITYSDEHIIGFNSNQSLATPASRMLFLDEIIRDIIILSESEYIVCGLSSNFCRLVLELKSCHQSDASLHLRSLDAAYRYHLHYFLIPLRLNFV